MFEQFTERARQVVILAQDESRALRHDYIGTEHLLLGLIREEHGLGARILINLGVRVEDVRTRVEAIVGLGDVASAGQIPFTPRAKKVLELSLREALALGHNYIGTEHVLLGLSREDKGVAMRVLHDIGLESAQLRADLIAELVKGAKKAFGQTLEWISPPLAPEVQVEIERLRGLKEQALEAEDFSEAANLRRRERILTTAARGLEEAWRHEVEQAGSPEEVVEAAPDEPVEPASASESAPEHTQPGPAAKRGYEHRAVTLERVGLDKGLRQVEVDGWELLFMIPSGDLIAVTLRRPL